MTLKQARLSDQVIIEKIMSSPVNFQLGVSDLVALSKAGIDDSITTAMLQASRH